MEADRSGVIATENDVTVRTIVRGNADITASGDTVLVTNQGFGNVIRVLAVKYRGATSPRKIRFKSGATGNISARYSINAGEDLDFPYNLHGWFQTSANEGLVVNQDVAGDASADFTYVVVAI